MNISKLTITPIMSKTSSIVIKNPSSEIAEIFIKEKLTSNYGFQKPKRPKMPKFLKGFMNPKTYIGKYVDTYK